MALFTGTTVLELASVLAGPAVGQFFAELGAEVIKVENPRTGGDVTRSWKAKDEATDDRSAYFCAVNWGKRSVAVDMSSPDGRDIVHQLAMRSQIVIASYKPGDAEKLGVDYKNLSRLNPGLIYGQITGYGPDNPRVGYDAIIQAEAGFMSMNGEPGGAPLKMPVALIDILAAHHLKEGILLALLEKSVSGKGKCVEVSLFQAALASLANQGSNWLVGGKTPTRQGSAHPNIAPYGDLFLTADQRELLLAVGTDAQFRALCMIVGASEAIEDDRFKTNVLRVAHRSALFQVLAAAVAKFRADDLVVKLSRAHIPAGVIRNVREALHTEEARELLLEGDGLRGIRTFVAGADTSSHLLPPPRFGQNTAEVLSRYLSYSPENVEILYRKRVVV